MPITDNELLELAVRARGNSYCEYSHYAVGAALRCKDGTVYTGCNIENKSYSMTICAERTAIFKAVSDGRKKGDFEAIAIAGAPENEIPVKPCYPCGACRQVLAEFCGDGEDITVILQGETFQLSDLLPHDFMLKRT